MQMLKCQRDCPVHTAEPQKVVNPARHRFFLSPSSYLISTVYFQSTFFFFFLYPLYLTASGIHLLRSLSGSSSIQWLLSFFFVIYSVFNPISLPWPSSGPSTFRSCFHLSTLASFRVTRPIHFTIWFLILLQSISKIPSHSPTKKV